MQSFTKRADRRIVLLPTDELCPNPMQPRRQFEEAELLALSESIRRHGILQPITVRPADPMPYPDNLRGPSFEIIAGERRWRAAKLAGLEKVPCLLRQADKTQSAELALIENQQRSDLHFFEEAEAIRNLLLMTSLPQTELASRLAISPSALSNKLRLLRLSASERRLILENGLGERHARAFLKIKSDALRLRAIRRVIEEGLSASEAETLADQLNSGADVPAEPAEKKPQRISLIRDVRFFFNTLDRATAMLEEAGFAVRQQREETDGGYEIRLFVPAQRA